jgi:ATP-dependent helicase/nuclease subunit A
VHPIVAQMQPSREQEPPVGERGRDVVVTAGAGTGKTRTLVARYLSLVAEGVPLRSIVAITFTRKAAREMRNRVRDEIRVYLERPDLDGEERQRWQSLYAELDAARIGTIHSLCSEILKAHPAEAGVDPHFQVLDEGQGNILLGQVLASTLGKAADDQGTVELFGLLGEGALRSTLSAMLGRRLDVKVCFASLPAPLWPVWEARLLQPVRAFLDDPRIRACTAELVCVRDDGTLAGAEAAGDKLAGPLRRLLALWQEMAQWRSADNWVNILDGLPALRREMPRLGQAKNWQSHDPRPVLGELRERYDTQLKEHLGKGIDLAFERRLAEAVPVLASIFGHAAAAYEELKEERQALDYDDLEAGALRLLQHVPAVRARWQDEIQALLVDEFQDTNERQRDLVAFLNAGRGGLFIVGDAKQSIYGFRGADVVVFRRERQRIVARGGGAFSLETSYRAHGSLVAGLNALLRPVLGEEADPGRPWLEPFAPLRHHREEPAPGFLQPHIELHLAVGTKSAGALERAADALAGRLVELASGDREAVEEQGLAHSLDYGGVAILCRASTSFGAYEDALERAGVPFLTVAGRGFYGRPEVRDLLNILQALADPGDDLVLAGALRSPAFALSDAALYGLCVAHGEAGISLWDLLCQGHVEGCPAALPADGACARRAAEVIAGLHEQVGRMPVAGVLKAFLDLTGYRAALIEAGQARGARNVSKLLADAHGSGIVGVGEFLEYVAGLRDSGTREGEARATAEGAVQIMTVHAAKGLEFPVVVIGDVTRTAGRGGGLIIDPELGPLLPVRDSQGQLPAVYRLGKGREDDQEAAESDRLLYVVATRAREKLILSGCIGCKEDGSLGKASGWLGRLAGDACLGLDGRVLPYSPEGNRAHRLELLAGSTPVDCTIYEPGFASERRARAKPAQPEADDEGPPPLLGPVQAEAATADRLATEQEHPSVQRVWRVVPAVERPRAPARVIGSLVHEALAAWRFPAGRETAFGRWCEARARGYGLTDSRQLADAERQVRRLLYRFRGHALFHHMDRAGLRLHEVPYSLLVDGHVESGVIDALYLRDGVWTLVEFKTDRVKDEAELEELLDKEGYAAQARRYVAAAEQFLGQAPWPVLCLLNFAGVVALHSPDRCAGSHLPSIPTARQTWDLG